MKKIVRIAVSVAVVLVLTMFVAAQSGVGFDSSTVEAAKPEKNGGGNGGNGGGGDKHGPGLRWNGIN